MGAVPVRRSAARMVCTLSMLRGEFEHAQAIGRMNDRVARGLELAHQRVRQVERIFDEWNRRHFAWT